MQTGNAVIDAFGGLGSGLGQGITSFYDAQRQQDEAAQKKQEWALRVQQLHQQMSQQAAEEQRAQQTFDINRGTKLGSLAMGDATDAYRTHDFGAMQGAQKRYTAAHNLIDPANPQVGPKLIPYQPTPYQGPTTADHPLPAPLPPTQTGPDPNNQANWAALAGSAGLSQKPDEITKGSNDFIGSVHYDLLGNPISVKTLHEPVIRPQAIQTRTMMGTDGKQHLWQASADGWSDLGVAGGQVGIDAASTRQDKGIAATNDRQQRRFTYNDAKNFYSFMENYNKGFPGVYMTSGRRTYAQNLKLYNDDLAAHGGKPSGMVARPEDTGHGNGTAGDYYVPPALRTSYAQGLRNQGYDVKDDYPSSNDHIHVGIPHGAHINAPPKSAVKTDSPRQKEAFRQGLMVKAAKLYPDKFAMGDAPSAPIQAQRQAYVDQGMANAYPGDAPAPQPSATPMPVIGAGGPGGGNPGKRAKSMLDRY